MIRDWHHCFESYLTSYAFVHQRGHTLTWHDMTWKVATSRWHLCQVTPPTNKRIGANRKFTRPSKNPSGNAPSQILRTVKKGKGTAASSTSAPAIWIKVGVVTETTHSKRASACARGNVNKFFFPIGDSRNWFAEISAPACGRHWRARMFISDQPVYALFDLAGDITAAANAKPAVISTPGLATSGKNANSWRTGP